MSQNQFNFNFTAPNGVQEFKPVPQPQSPQPNGPGGYMYTRSPQMTPPPFGGFGRGGPPPNQISYGSPSQRPGQPPQYFFPPPGPYMRGPPPPQYGMPPPMQFMSPPRTPEDVKKDYELPKSEEKKPLLFNFSSVQSSIAFDPEEGKGGEKKTQEIVNTDTKKTEVVNEPKVTVKETPTETPKDTPEVTPKETPKVTPRETPKETPRETPKQVIQKEQPEVKNTNGQKEVDQKPKEIVKETPKEDIQKPKIIEVASSEDSTALGSENEQDLDQGSDEDDIDVDQYEIEYPENGWSPDHMNFPKVYSIEFLAQFEQFCNLFPAVLDRVFKTVPIGCDQPFEGPEYDRMKSNKIGVKEKDFRGRHNLRRQEDEQGNGVWKRPKKFGLSQDEKKVMEIRGILNRLTPQTFEELFDKIIRVCFADQESTELLIDLFYKKAIREPNYAEMYSQLAVKLSFATPLYETTKRNNFRTLLLVRCQQEFMGRRSPPVVPDHLSKEEQMELEIKGNRIREGNDGAVILIGELFIHRMIPEKVMHFCIAKLLSKEDEQYDLFALESLCKLLSTIGEYLDSGKKKVAMEHYFGILEEISLDKENIPTRNRFIVLDIVDLRNNRNWVPRRAVAKPKKMKDASELRAMGNHTGKSKALRKGKVTVRSSSRSRDSGNNNKSSRGRGDRKTYNRSESSRFRDSGNNKKRGGSSDFSRGNRGNRDSRDNRDNRDNSGRSSAEFSGRSSNEFSGGRGGGGRSNSRNRNRNTPKGSNRSAWARSEN